METEKNYGSISVGLIGLLGVVMFSAKSVFAKLAYLHGASPLSVLYLRVVIALPLVLVVFFWYERKYKSNKIKWIDIAKVAAYSVLGYYISAIFNFTGLLYVEASIERLILFLYPTMVIILTSVFLKKKIGVKQIISIAISYVGLIVAFADKLMIKADHAFWLGALLIFLSAFTYAIFLTASDSIIHRIGSVRFTNIAILTMCICVIVHAGITGNTHISGYQPQVYWNCILMAVFSTVVPVYMFNYAMGKLGAANLSVISCLGPICTLSYSAMLLNEHITLFQIVGTIIVISGILVMYINPIPFRFFIKYFRKLGYYRI